MESSDAQRRERPRLAAPANQKICLITAPDGPWTPAGRGGLILDLPKAPAIWSQSSVVGVNNPTRRPMPDGRNSLNYQAVKPGNG